MENESVAAQAAAPVPRRVIPFEFSATGGEYFRIWIVNLLLTILTLGIYSAWAKVRKLRYFYGSTSLDGSAFEYHGRPLQILKGRAIAVGALILYSVLTTVWPLSAFILIPVLALAVPWVIVRSRMFQMRMTSWRNIRSGFHGEYRGALGAYVGWGLVALVSLYTLVPLWLHARVRFLLNNTSYGTQRFAFAKLSGPYFKLFYKAIGLAVVAVITLLVMKSIVPYSFVALIYQAYPDTGPIDPRTLILGSLLFSGLVAILVAMPAFAYFHSAFTNTTFDGLAVGQHRVRSRLRASPLAWIMLTNLVGVVLTLGLFFPWAIVRQTRYQLANMQLEAEGSLDDFTAAAAPATSATGEELGEFFDVDFGL